MGNIKKYLEEIYYDLLIKIALVGGGIVSMLFLCVIAFRL